MTMYTIDRTIDIAAPLAPALAAVTTEAGFRGWLAQDTDLDGDRVTFRFSLPTVSRTVTLRIDRRDARGIELTCIAHENNPDWVGTRLAIDLAETATGARVHLAHAGYPAKNEVYERCTDAWEHFLGSLARYVTQGRGEPYPKAA
jgi:uncharacterized protein YndB with AHSA1/START domain